MKSFRFSLMVAFALVLILSSLITVETSTAIEIDPETTIQTTADNRTFFEKVEGFFFDLVNVIVDFISAPFNAVASVWESWGDNLGSVWAPLIAMAVILLVWYIIKFSNRSYMRFDKWLDSKS